MRKKVILITGAAGEIGQALIKSLAATGSNQVLSLDLHDLPDDMDGYSTHILGDVLDKNLFARLVTEYDFDVIYHLAALLSTRSEFAPELAHQVNVNGTLLLMQMAAEQSQRRGRPVSFIFPSSMAAYGVPNLDVKARDRRVKEWQWNSPTTMYGCNKLYCEQLGIYYSKHYQQLSASRPMTCTRAPFFTSCATSAACRSPQTLTSSQKPPACSRPPLPSWRYSSKNTRSSATCRSSLPTMTVFKSGRSPTFPVPLNSFDIAPSVG